jgi:cytoskeletal protein CcmA (bactofilin family)
MIIGSKNKMKGDIKFEGILRIDGVLEGNIIAPIEVCSC